MDRYTKIVLTVIAAFSFGYVCNDVIRENKIDLTDKVHAMVAGMDFNDLEHDWDFTNAVRSIIKHSCHVEGTLENRQSGHVYGEIVC